MEVALQHLMEFDGVQKVTEDIGEVANVLIAIGLIVNMGTMAVRAKEDIQCGQCKTQDQVHLLDGTYKGMDVSTLRGLTGQGRGVSY